MDQPTYVTQWQDTAGRWCESTEWYGSERQNGTDLYAALAFADMVTREGRNAQIMERYERVCSESFLAAARHDCSVTCR